MIEDIGLKVKALFPVGKVLIICSKQPTSVYTFRRVLDTFIRYTVSKLVYSNILLVKKGSHDSRQIPLSPAKDLTCIKRGHYYYYPSYWASGTSAALGSPNILFLSNHPVFQKKISVTRARNKGWRVAGEDVGLNEFLLRHTALSPDPNVVSNKIIVFNKLLGLLRLGLALGFGSGFTLYA